MCDLELSAAIDRKTGLEQYEGDEKMFAAVIENFAHNNNGTYAKLKSYISAGDFNLAYRTAHSLRGAAGAISAKRLGEAAFTVEETLLFLLEAGPHCSIEILNEKMTVLEEEFNAVFDTIEMPDKGREMADNFLSVIDRERTIALIEKLEPFLESGNAECLEYLNSIDEVFRPVADKFRLFITQVGLYDFEQAHETLESIRRFMNP